MNNSANPRLRTSWTASVRSVFVSVLLMASAPMTFGQNSSTCHTCKPTHVPGSVVEFGMTLGQLSADSLTRLSDGDSLFMGNLYGFCTDFAGGVNGARTFRKRILNEMEKLPVNGEIDLYFLEAGCNAEEFRGDARSPMAHLAAELPTVWTAHLEVIRAYFIEKKKTGLFTRMINARNTFGYTTLDYVHYMVEKGKYIDSQKPHIGTFVDYLCSNGGVYAFYRNKSCGAR